MVVATFGPIEAPPGDHGGKIAGAEEYCVTPSMMAALKRFAQEKGLTARETQVLLMICQGNKDLLIAKRLKISRATVRFHIKNIHAKSKTSDKLEIVLSAWRECTNRCAQCEKEVS